MKVISAADVAHVARLSRLHLTKAEQERYARDLSLIFDYVETLQAVDTAQVVETCQVTGLEDSVREDEVRPTYNETRDKLLAAFPERAGDLLRVKGVFGSE